MFHISVGDPSDYLPPRNGNKLKSLKSQVQKRLFVNVY